MSILNALLRNIFDIVLLPLRGLPPLVGITLLALLLGVGMLLIFKATSNQTKIDAVKRKIHAGIFEIRLFNDDLRAIFRAQGDVLRHNLRYLGLSLVPMLWMIVPMVLIIAQLQFHWGYDGLEVGEASRMNVVLKGDWQETHPDLMHPDSGRPVISLTAPQGLAVESPALWFPSRREVAWRIRPVEEGNWDLPVAVGSDVYEKSADATTGITRRSPARLSATFLNQLLYPAEAALPKDGAVQSIALAYPDATVGIFGVRLHWLVPFFVLSLVFAFMLKDRFGVKI